MTSGIFQRRYNRRILVLSALYAVMLANSVHYFRDHPGAGGAWAYLFAVLPALPIVAIFGVIGRYLIEERDEYLRLLMARQALVATGLTLGVATIWGFVEDAGLARHLPAYYVAVLWFAGLGLGACVNYLIERRAA